MSFVSPRLIGANVVQLVFIELWGRGSGEGLESTPTWLSHPF